MRLALNAVACYPLLWFIPSWQALPGQCTHAGPILARPPTRFPCHPTLQSLLQAVGVGAKRSLPAAATINWVLKDGLGRLGRLTVATRFGESFDSDLKRFRYTTSVIYAVSLRCVGCQPWVGRWVRAVWRGASGPRAGGGEASGSGARQLLPPQALWACRRQQWPA